MEASDFGGWPATSYISMDAGRYRERLQRAIEAELVFQAARDRGVGLTEGQQRRLDTLRFAHEANLEELSPLGVTWDSVEDEQVDLEERTMAAMMLRQNLVAAEGSPTPSLDPVIQSAYERALRKLLRDLTGKADIVLTSKAPG